MVFVEKSFEQMLYEIGFERFIRDDNICPGKNPELFKKALNADAFLPSLEYRWGIWDQVQSIRRPEDDLSNTLFSIVEEVMLNMYERAHNCDDNLNMSVKIAEGSEGYVLRFGDSGKEFNFREKIEKFRKNEKYEKRWGYGLEALNLPHVEASFEGDGSILNVKFRKYKPAGVWEEGR